MSKLKSWCLSYLHQQHLFHILQGSFQFTRTSYDTSFGGILTAAWNAQAYDSRGNPVGSTVGESQTSRYSTSAPVQYSFSGTDITKVTFYRDTTNTSAGIAQVPIDNLVLTYSSGTFIEPDDYGGYASWDAYCKGEFGLDYFYNELEYTCDYDDSEVVPDVSPELQRLGDLGMEAYENGECNLALNYFNQALALHEMEAYVKWFIGAIYSDCLGDHKTALPYLEDSLTLAKSDPEIPEEIIVEIQKAIDLVKDLMSTSTTTPAVH